MRRSAPTRRKVRVTTPPAAIKIKPVTVDTAPLSAAYEWMALDKDVAFRMAFDWYAANRPLLVAGSPLDGDRLKTFQRAEKSRNQGDGTTFQAERETAYMTALRQYEKLWAAEKNLPTVDAAALLPSVRMKNIQHILTSLNAAYEQHGIVFGVTAGDTRAASNGKILLPQTELDAMVGQSVLQSVLKEAQGVAKRISTVEVKVNAGETLPDGSVNDTGVPQIFQRLDGRAFMTNIDAVLNSVTTWAGSIGSVTPVGKPHTATARKSSGTRPPKLSNVSPIAPTGSVVDPFGIFRPNTAKAAIASLMNDRQWHDVSKLTAIVAGYGVRADWQLFDFREYLLKKRSITVEMNADKTQWRIPA